MSSTEHLERGNGLATEEDLVNLPPHYTQGKLEVIEIIESLNLSYHLSNAVKYLARSKHKGNEKQDLEKAIWYINRHIEVNL